MQDENTTRVVFSSRLRAAMESNSLTQSDLAEAIGLSQAAISKWLKGSIPAGDQLLKAARRLGVSMEWLLGGDGSSTPSTQTGVSLTRARGEAERLAKQLSEIEATTTRMLRYLGR